MLSCQKQNTIVPEIETDAENLQLGQKLTHNKKSTVLAQFLWNLVIFACSLGGHIDQVL